MKTIVRPRVESLSQNRVLKMLIPYSQNKPMQIRVIRKLKKKKFL